VKSIGGDLSIAGSTALTSFTGLENLTSIDGNLKIGNQEWGGNPSLTNLSGLSNVTSIGGELWIWDNDVLTSLSGLDNVTSIGGDLRIEWNDALTSLSGLDNVTSIGGDLFIMHSTLTSLSGMDNVTSIGGHLWLEANASLTSLSGLDNVTSFGGELWIWDNDVLTSLSGLDNIEAGSISDLHIYQNISLSTCEVQSVCDYLISPIGTIEIHDNTTGCNSPEEVEEACTVSVESIYPEEEISIFPNPANRELTISIKDGTIEEVNIYNLTGQKVIHEKPANNILDISKLQQGMYIIEVVSGQKRIREKLMVE